MARNKAFTLVELLVAIATLALLAAVLAPITAQAKKAASTVTTASNLKQIGLAANMYAVDYDNNVVLTQYGQTDTKHWWAVSLQPYSGTRNAFWDPSRTVPTGTNVTVNGLPMPWYEVTNLSINEGGYTGSWSMLNNGATCASRRSYLSYGRSLSAMSEPNMRVAFAPTVNGLNFFGTSSFHTFESNWINTALLPSVLSWNNVVYNTRTLYTGGSIPVVHADGSAGTLNRSNFKDHIEAPTQAAYCAWMSTEGQRTWGSFWNVN